MRFSLFLFFLFCLIILRYFLSTPVYQNGQRLRISAKVLQEPARYPNTQRVVLSGLKFYLPLFPEIHYGYQIVVEGTVEGGELKGAKLIKIEESKEIIYRLRDKIISFYQQSLPEPHASLLSGITLGSKANIPPQFWLALTKTGTAHVVVASGMNVSLVAAFLLNFILLFLARRKAIPVTILGVFAYAVISGFEAPIVRAALMGTITFTAQVLGRLSTAWKALVFSAFVMLIYRPGYISDIGFILSFVATASLMLFQKPIEERLKFLPKIIKQDFSTSLAAQIGVTPILFVTFGQFNILSPIINAMVLWTVPLIMIIGAVGAMVGMFVPFLGKMILYLSYPLTAWFVWVVEKTSLI